MDEKDKGQSSSNSSSGRLSPTTLLAQRLLKLAAEEPPVAVGRGRGVVPRGSSPSSSVKVGSSSGGAFDRSAFLLKTLSTMKTSGAASASPAAAPVAPVPLIGRGRAHLLPSLQALRNPGVAPQETQPTQNATRNIESAPLEFNKTQAPPLKIETESLPVAPEEEIISPQIGSSGRSVNLKCNYIKLNVKPDMGVYEYEVKFYSEIDSKGMKIKLLNQHLTELGGVKTFDGVTLYLPILLDESKKKLLSIHPIDQSSVKIEIIYKKQKKLGECIHLYNVLFRRIMNCLELVTFQRQHFDPNGAKVIPQHQLEIWPGYVTNVNEFRGGVMLCLDISHRVLRQQTVLNFMSNLARYDANNFVKNAKSGLIGSHILTRYNNRTYRIDDIDFKMSPMSVFETSQGKKITFCEYYKKQYNIDILDLDQPLLISISNITVAGYADPIESRVCLLPELSYLTGISDDIRNNFRIMRDIATYTRVSPEQRLYGFRKFILNVNKNSKARELLSSWGLSLDNDCIQVSGRTLEPEDIIFSNKTVEGNKKASWGQDCVRHKVLDSKSLDNWVIIHSRQDQRTAINFKDCILRCGPPMGIDIEKPIMKSIPDDRTDTYLKETHRVIQENNGVQLIVYIFPTMRDDRYAAVKKVCLTQYGIASQVINTRTISASDKLRTVCQKVALQINCKLGGSLWATKIPLKNAMICGIDTYHDPKGKGQSVIGFVSSVNQSCTSYYNQVGFQNPRDELGQSIKSLFQKALKRYFDAHGAFPSKIICYRDGVGDGDLKQCKSTEIRMMEECFEENVFGGNKPQIIFIVVQKRINTRFVAQSIQDYVNPEPGSIIDHTITKKNMYDFYLVAQSVNQGTVSPSHYIVVQDKSSLKPDHIQRLSFKMCHLYYNWPGTIRVPACCQYAHKLAYLIGEHVKSRPHANLEDTLYYL